MRKRGKVWTRLVTTFTTIVLLLSLAGQPEAKAGPAPEHHKSAAQALARLNEVMGVPPFQTTRIFDRHGNLLAEIADRGRRTVIPLEQVPLWLIQATIATEDKNFYWHNGIDAGAIIRAAWQNLLAGKIVSGGSTIPQQLARLLLMGEEERYQQSLARKFREVGLAWSLNRRFSKDELLELYLNTVYYGNQAYGIAAAAEVYFGKKVSELSLAESSLLAGLPQSPNRLDPYTNWEGARSRQQIVLELMRRRGYLSQAQVVTALSEEIRLRPKTTFQEAPRRAPHFVDYVREILVERYGTEGIYLGLQVYTSLDLRYQELAETIARAQIAALQERHQVSNAAIVILHPPSGEILAMMGSLDYWNPLIDGQVNVAIRPRQPGSAIKPILYAAAFESGWTPASVIWDTPVRYPLLDNRWYSPRNVTGRYYGPLRLRLALANSLNVSAVKLLHAVGVERMLETARRMGIQSWKLPPDHYGLSLGVGGYEVTLLELTHAYATLANQGTYVPLTPITEIRDASGKLLFQSRPPDPPHYAVSPAAAYQVTSSLSDSRSRQMVFGPRSPLDTSHPTAVKTGTTDNWRDNLTVGYTPYLAVGVWVGNSNGRPMRNAFGYRTAGPIWHDILEAIWADPNLHDSLGYQGRPLPRGFERPAGVVQVPVCELSPGVFHRSCPLAYEEILTQPSEEARLNQKQEMTEQLADTPGYCLPTLAPDLPLSIRREAAFIPLPQAPADAAAARRWAADQGLPLRRLNTCDWTPVSRPLAQPPPLPEPVRLVHIPEPTPMAASRAVTSVADSPMSPGTAVRLIQGVRALHIRAGAGVDQPVRDYLLPEDEAVIQEGSQQVGDRLWYEIRKRGTDTIGWVNGAYLRPLPPAAPPAEQGWEEVMLDTEAATQGQFQIGQRVRLRPGISALNIRTGAGVESGIIDRAEPQDMLRILEGPRTVVGSPWYAIIIEGEEVTGWVNGNYLMP